MSRDDIHSNVIRYWKIEVCSIITALLLYKTKVVTNRSAQVGAHDNVYTYLTLYLKIRTRPSCQAFECLKYLKEIADLGACTYGSIEILKILQSSDLKA